MTQKNINEKDLGKFGWTFGTYPKICSKCPEGSEFLGDKDSTLCQPHALQRYNETTSQVVVSVVKRASG